MKSLSNKVKDSMRRIILIVMILISMILLGMIAVEWSGGNLIKDSSQLLCNNLMI